MSENNKENSAPLKPISLNKRDYPEIYGYGENKLSPASKAILSPAIKLPETEEIGKNIPAAVYTKEEKKPPAENTGLKPLSAEDKYVFIGYLLGAEDVVWACRSPASAKAGKAAIFPFSVLFTLFGILMALISVSERLFAGLAIWALMTAAGIKTVLGYLRGAHDSYFALTNERIIYLSRKDFQTEHINKIIRADISPHGKRMADVRLIKKDGNVTVLKELDTDSARQIRAAIENEIRGGGNSFRGG